MDMNERITNINLKIIFKDYLDKIIQKDQHNIFDCAANEDIPGITIDKNGLMRIKNFHLFLYNSLDKFDNINSILDYVNSFYESTLLYTPDCFRTFIDNCYDCLLNDFGILIKNYMKEHNYEVNTK